MYGDIILQLIREFQRHFPRNLRHSVGMFVLVSQSQVTRDVIDCNADWLIQISEGLAQGGGPKTRRFFVSESSTKI